MSYTPYKMRGPSLYAAPTKQVVKKSTSSAHGQMGDAQHEYEQDLQNKSKEGIVGISKPYEYKINGKSVTQKEYNAYQNKPGSDEPGKTTNNPDANGNKAKTSNARSKNKASNTPTVRNKKPPVKMCGCGKKKCSC